MDWGSFWTGVAVTVVGGLILFALIEGPRWYRRRQKQEAKDAERRYIQRMPIHVGGPIVAGELRLNADLAKRCEQGSHVPSEARQLELIAWRERRGDIAGLEGEDPRLWTELRETYEALERSKRDGGHPPASAILLDLAGRLEKASRAGSERPRA
jgi:hypothetical protein